jgi:hypothetical protein
VRRDRHRPRIDRHPVGVASPSTGVLAAYPFRLVSHDGGNGQGHLARGDHLRGELGGTPAPRFVGPWARRGGANAAVVRLDVVASRRRHGFGRPWAQLQQPLTSPILGALGILPGDGRASFVGGLYVSPYSCWVPST